MYCINCGKKIEDGMEYCEECLQQKKKSDKKVFRTKCIFAAILSLIVLMQCIYLNIKSDSKETRFKFYEKCSTAKEAVNMYLEKYSRLDEGSRGCLHPIYSMSGMLDSKYSNLCSSNLDNIGYYHSFEILAEDKMDKDKIDELEYYIEQGMKQSIEEQDIEEYRKEHVLERDNINYSSFLKKNNFDIKNAKVVTGRFFTSRRNHSERGCDGNHKFAYVGFSCDVVEWKGDWYVLKFEIEETKEEE